jgi:AcrR family transcriptional regulator
MDVKASIICGLRTLLAHKPFLKVTVSDICQYAGISRKTFYKYFEDKGDLVESMVYDDLIGPTLLVQKVLPVQNIKTMTTLMLERTYQGYRDNKAIYENLLNGLGEIGLLKVLMNVIWSYTKELYETYELPSEERDFASYCLAAAQSMIQLRYIQDGCLTSPQKMARYCNAYLFAHAREAGLGTQFL